MDVPDRGRVVLIVGLISILAAGLLAATAWRPQEQLAPGEPTAGSTGPFDGTEPVPPSDFYEPPTPLPDAPAGTLLSSEEIKETPDGYNAWRIMYLSADNDRKPIAVSGYYVEPDRPPNLGTRFPLIAMAHGTTGVSSSCGMSTGPFTAKSTGSEYWNFLVKPMVDAGYAVVATDYEGQGVAGKTPYLMRKQAYDVLDSMRASIDLRPGFIDTTNLGIIGHSEGGYVALTTADQAPSYAPDLAIRGSVVIAPGVLPPIPAGVAALTSQTGDERASPRSGYITTLSQAWLANYPDRLAPEDWYTPEGAAAVLKAAEECQGGMVQILDDTFGTYFNKSLPDEVIEIAAENPPLRDQTTVPLLILQGAKDTGVVPQLSRAIALEACNLGDVVEFKEYPNDVHRSVQFTGRTDFLDWLADRFAGQPAPNQCRELG